MRVFLFLISLVTFNLPALASVVNSHGYAQFETLKYDANFTHFDWVNPNAPKSGTVRLMAFGTFDTLNPYTLKGTSPIGTADFTSYGVSELNEPLMVGSGNYDPSGDEPASAYGLIAESVQYNDSRSWVVFNLRKEARFHDGTPITAKDVAFSYRTLLKQGHPQYRTYLQEVKRVDILSHHRIRFVFKRAGNPLLILRMGDLPVLPEHYWRDKDFSKTTFEPPLGSGPYQITAIKPGRSLEFERVKDWWGKDLAVNRGKYNFDKVIVDFYRDKHVAFEAFKVGSFDFYIEHQAKNWANNYRFPDIAKGKVIRAEIPHQIPTQTQALFINTRRAQFHDVATREALTLLFDFEWANRTLFNNAYQRANSYYPNSDFSARDVPSGAEGLLLTKWREQLPLALFLQPFNLEQTQGRGIPRETLRKALGLLAEAGWRSSAKGLRNRLGQQLELEILLVNPSLERILQAYVNTLNEVGIAARMRTVDRAQYKQRLDNFDFDLTLLTLPQTLSPGLEQWQYFHSSQAMIKGSKNYAGVSSPVIDDLLEKLLSAKTYRAQRQAARALDRALLWNYYSIPNWYISHHRIAYQNRFEFVRTPPYTLGLRAWWLKPSEIK
ncbi:MAG: ABC transporter substrate-binding protein [Gammaproteobacteria bacterium]|nr:ABC transporter substrate-binding protein [Gammaproteobacteria bacterium]